MDKYQNTYRIASTRATFWNYGWEAAYFVTICTRGRVHFFGEVRDGEMALSDIGEIVDKEWLKTFDLRPDMNLWMGEYVVMPNHFHAIIGIGENQFNTKRDTERDTERRDARHRVSTTGQKKHNQFGPQSKNLASIMRGFKSAVTINARRIDPRFAWQARYHDHIIRSAASYGRISNYIVNNPTKWRDDKFYR